MRSGGVYGAAAALLLLPAALARPAVDGADDETTRVEFTLNVPKKDQGTEALTFGLDVRRSDEACGADSVRVNGRGLGQDARGEGEGALAVRGGRGEVSARWAFSCVEAGDGTHEQVVAVTLRRLDAVELGEAGFSVVVRQPADAVFGPARPDVVVGLYGPGMGDELRALAPVEGARGGGEDWDDLITSTEPSDIDDELWVRLDELELLLRHSQQIDDLIRVKELAIDELVAKLPAVPKPPPPPPPSPLSQCGLSLRCMWAYLTQRVKQAVGDLSGDVAELQDFMAHAHGHALPMAPDEGQDEAWRHGWDGEVSWDREAAVEKQGQGLRPNVYDVSGLRGEQTPLSEYPLTPEEMGAWDEADDYVYRFSPRQPPLLMTIALAALALGSLSLWGIHQLHRRTLRLSTKAEREGLCGSSTDRDRDARRARRRARRAAQVAAVGGFVAALLSRWTARGEDRAGDDDEKRAPGSRRRSDSEAEGRTTMEEEIAQLREAASFVGDMVAAEEGRAKQQQQPPRQAGSFMGIIDDEGLPPYLPPYDGGSQQSNRPADEK